MGAIVDEDLCRETVPMTAKLVGNALDDVPEAKAKKRERNRMENMVGEAERVLYPLLRWCQLVTCAPACSDLSCCRDFNLPRDFSAQPESSVSSSCRSGLVFLNAVLSRR